MTWVLRNDPLVPVSLAVQASRWKRYQPLVKDREPSRLTITASDFHPLADLQVMDLMARGDPA
ncbi:MAG: hypothetical protein CMK92_09915 [Pseudomonas sp.]|jgi:hypothetical protein|nr:hypothetical protein [Pseudomonas sp.]